MVLMILTVGIIPLAVIQHHARKEVQEADAYSQTVNVAQAQMERIKGLGFNNAASDSGQVGDINWVAQVSNVKLRPGKGCGDQHLDRRWRQPDRHHRRFDVHALIIGSRPRGPHNLMNRARREE
jgi:type II secretory pathway pseudopilin PulG